MEKLQERLIKMLNGYSFKEMLDMLNKQKEPVARGAIMEAMETYHEAEFLAWIG